MLGKHLIIDVYDIEDIEQIKTCEGIYEMMNEIVEKSNLHVINYMSYNFNPYGCSMVYLLSESHLSIHTYYLEGAVSIDLYTCNKETDMSEICHIIYKNFKNSCKIKKRIVER